MSNDILLLVLAFFEGLALILSPCILPILPLILAGSVSGSKKRPNGIIVGFILVFALFTFSSRKLAEISGLDLELIRHISYVLLFLFGLIMVSTYLTEKFARWTGRLANVGASSRFINNPGGGFVSGLLFGGLVALIWTPCAGPILAAVIVQTVLQKTTVTSLFILLSFSLGVALPLFLLAYFGRRLLSALGLLKRHTVFLRKLLGIIIMLSVIYLAFFQAQLTLNLASGAEANTAPVSAQDATEAYPAPELSGLTAWINSPPLQLSDLKGKVVLIDFWTYSCINCLRTLPYVKAWYKNYHDQGLIIIGVHTPEFDFEKNYDNVVKAVKEDGILYPVALDNNFGTWQAYHNQYWPAHYLIDKQGRVVYTHFGEGNYAETEAKIRELLGIQGHFKPALPEKEAATSPEQSPETYLGGERQSNFAGNHLTGTDSYSFPTQLDTHAWALSGKWALKQDRIVSKDKNSALRFHFAARKVYIVAGSASGLSIPVQVSVDGKPKDSLNIRGKTLYPVLTLEHFGQGILELRPLAPGLELYTFTFGN